ncbi:hypothetical protein [uncultured Psychroserpens sp.]|uniref:hypothetical protein n=1 Tax=uncultured Psychroserpens sp. TaxID=255436 RepID=UPI0026387162|nr:hypothetical protein [uncultured Psychroserpens sp.]
MNLKRTLLIAIGCFSIQVMFAQELTAEQKERLEYKIDIFTSGEKEIQELWYEDQMDKMKLKGELRENYKKIVVYHAYKMERLDDLDKKLNDKEVYKALQKQLKLMNTDVKEILNTEQYVIHDDTWKAILRAVYYQKKWDN